jgi:hypothetical protein
MRRNDYVQNLKGETKKIEEYRKRERDKYKE